MKIAKNIFTMICDDVREEKGNKLSLMGLYEKEYIVSHIPLIIPRICLIIMLSETKEILNKVHITLKSPKSEPISINFDKLAKVEKGKDSRVIVYLSPFKINGTGEATFEIKFNNDKKASIVHRFNIKKFN